MGREKKEKANSKEADPAAVDAWLAKLPGNQRVALERLRELIRAAAPQAIETIAYGVPQYYRGTTQMLGFSAAKNHLSLGIGHEVLDTMRDELEGYDAAKGVVRFTVDEPLPAALVTKLVKARMKA